MLSNFEHTLVTRLTIYNLYSESGTKGTVNTNSEYKLLMEEKGGVVYLSHSPLK